MEREAGQSGLAKVRSCHGVIAADAGTVHHETGRGRLTGHQF